jgi:hypothetical protein
MPLLHIACNFARSNTALTSVISNLGDAVETLRKPCSIDGYTRAVSRSDRSASNGALRSRAVVKGALRCRNSLLILWLWGTTFLTLCGQPASTQSVQAESQRAPNPALPGTVQSDNTTQGAQVSLQLHPSADDKINSSCHLEAAKNSLAKENTLKNRNKLIEKFNKCVEHKEEQAGKKTYSIAPLEEVQSLAPPSTSATVQASAPTSAAPANVPGATAPGVAIPPLSSQGEQVTQSAWGTPDACATGTAGAAAGKGLLYVHRALVWPKQATDDFGYRLGRRFVVYQVSVTNASTEFEYEIGDIVVDLEPIFTKLQVPLIETHAGQKSQYAMYEASSQDLSMLRGVPEKGQDYDPRNMTLHILQGIGSVAAGIDGLTPFSDVMGPAMANFNGPFIQAITGIAPDHTSSQLNRLSDMAFTSNTLIGKLQTKKFAIFIPEDFVMVKDQENDYWKKPRELLKVLPFDQLNVCIDGILLLQAATTPDPTFSSSESNVAPGSTISLADSATGATIYYTINGDTPTTSSSKYSTPITIGALGTPPVTIKAFALAASETPSNTIVGTFTPASVAQKPTIACGADKKSATITSTTLNDTVYYTVDGTVPNRQSPAITGATTVTFSGASESIQAEEVGISTSLSPVVSQTCPGT